VGERLADRWLGCRGYCQPGLDRSPGILAGEAFVEAGGRLDRQQAAVDRDQGIAAGMSLSAIDVVSSLPELSVRAAPAAMKPTQAPNIDPNRKTVANVTEQPPQQLIAFGGLLLARPELQRTPPTRGVAKIGSNARVRYGSRSAWRISKNHNSEKVARIQHIAFLRTGPLL
jgi:hypothetical protein